MCMCVCVCVCVRVNGAPHGMRAARVVRHVRGVEGGRAVQEPASGGKVNFRKARVVAGGGKGGDAGL